jgi:hypothetical protein
VIEKKFCPDCKLELPLKQFAQYWGKRHTLCRTCLAIDVAEFKDWVLPYTEKRRAEGPPERGTEDWEIAVKERVELSMKDKSAILQREPAQAARKSHRHPRFAHKLTPELIRPWKFA